MCQNFKDRLSKACEAPRTNLKSAQRKMKRWYDVNAKERQFMPRDRVLALLPIPGPYTVDKQISDVNYIVNTPGRRKQKQLCHVNMLKQYIDRDNSSVTSINVIEQSLKNKVK